jgi:exopolysaccharide biosynthesis polyprenyl glycosylphosphotransferase
MYHDKLERFDWRFALRVSDVVAVLLAFPVSFRIWAALSAQWPALPQPANVTALNCLFYAACALFAFHRLRLYAWTSFLRPSKLAARLAASLLVAGPAVLVIDRVVSPSPSFTYAPWLALDLVVTFALVFCLRLGLRAALAHEPAVERIAFVAWSSRLQIVLRALVKEMGAYQEVVGCIYESGDPSRDPNAGHGYELLGSLDQLERILAEHRISMLLVDQNSVTPRDMRHVADIAADSLVTLRMIPWSFDIWANRLSLRVVAGIPIMGINDLHHDRFGNRLLKRALDIVCALAGLLASAPIIAVLAALIRRESPGPVFYRQTRLGLHGQPFQIVKLRSMPLDAEKETGAVWAVEDDPRRLRVGRFMRRWNLDELPQFWNVLKGDMSMVGPRPERPEFVEGFRETVRYYNLRHTCKPGITGWAAVHGLRGNTSLEERLEYDLYYIENWSLWLDLKILLMTLAPPRNAY